MYQSRTEGLLPNTAQRKMAQTWKEFEDSCESLIEKAFPNRKFRIESQRRVYFSDGSLKIMDYHVAQRRPGGNHYVIDCKHYPKASLSRREVDATLEYKRRSRASKAIILISRESNIGGEFLRYAKEKGVLVKKVRQFDSKLLNTISKWRFKIKLD